MSGVKGKIIAITGASSGIGEATARRLATEGARVVLGARRTDRLEKVVAEIRQAGGSADCIALDVTKRASMKAFIDFALAKHGRLDVLVGNAGIMPLSPMAAGKVDEWEAMIDVNIKGILFGIWAALPIFLKQDSGHFVHVTSGADRIVGPTAAVYCGTKFAVRAISDGLRMEQGRNIRVSVVAPGATTTELAESISDPEFKKAVLGSVFADPMSPDTIAAAISFAIGQPAGTDCREILIGPSSMTV